MKQKILIVEDEKAILQGLEDLFVFNGYEVVTRSDGAEGLAAALASRFDCIILDVMLPSMDGFTICNEIRKQSREQPIVMLTAKNSEQDIINGLSLGADDYIAKPFSVRELILRIEAILRRSGKELNQETLNIGDDIEIDLDGLSAKIYGDIVLFTRREIDIIQYLNQHSPRPASRKDLLSDVWGYNKSADIDTRTVDIHMAKLRKKIEKDSKNPSLLITVRGEGYMLRIPA
ncbi:MAG: DNA-binding response OmpR family regulator [Flavobacteriales bacterium]|jgi:DNA-binding response OmpR family regulator